MINDRDAGLKITQIRLFWTRRKAHQNYTVFCSPWWFAISEENSFCVNSMETCRSLAEAFFSASTCWSDHNVNSSWWAPGWSSQHRELLTGGHIPATAPQLRDICDRAAGCSALSVNAAATSSFAIIFWITIHLFPLRCWQIPEQILDTALHTIQTEMTMEAESRTAPWFLG